MRKTILAVVASILVALGGAAAALYFYNRPTVLEVAVPHLAEDIRVMTAAAHIFSHDHNEIRLHMVPVEDSAAGAALLDSGKADLAVMRGDIALTTSAQNSGDPASQLGFVDRAWRLEAAPHSGFARQEDRRRA